MGQFGKGDVVIVPFPFSDLSASKLRPALVVASLTGNDVILCQITSQAKSDGYSVPITAGDFDSGRLPRESNARPNRLFTAESGIVVRKAGQLKATKTKEVVAKIVEIVSR